MSDLPRASATDDDRAIEIAPGVRLPRLGFGVWEVDAGDEGVAAITAALDAGYRHIDTAQGYENEQAVGGAIRASGLARDELFVTTKFFTGRADPEAEAEASLERLGLDHLDLYLVHDPRRNPTWAWPAMERVHERGLARAIGVSNFAAPDLDALLAIASVRPAVNQIQLNPFAHRRALIADCAERGIAVEAYSPLTRGRDLADPAIRQVAERVSRTPAQVMLRWGLQHGFVVLPKANHPARQIENAAVFDFELADADMAELDALDRTGGSARASETPWW
jgi:diketogulonate reductase-like aldo/keto reductase